MIARQLLAYCSHRIGESIAAPVFVHRNIPNLKYFEDRVATKMSDVVRCGVIIDKKAKTYEKLEKADCGRWNPQGFHTMMIPAKEDCWIKLFDDKVADEMLPREICGYIGMQPKPLKARNRNFKDDDLSSSEGDHDDNVNEETLASNPGLPTLTGSSMKFRLWRFYLLNSRQLKTIVNFRRERAAARGQGKRWRHNLRAKDFQDAPYFLIALPSPEIFLPNLLALPQMLAQPAEGCSDAQRSHAPGNEALFRKRRMCPASLSLESSGADFSGSAQEPAHKSRRNFPQPTTSEALFSGLSGSTAGRFPPPPQPLVPQQNPPCPVLPPADVSGVDSRPAVTEGALELSGAENAALSSTIWSGDSEDRYASSSQLPTLSLCSEEDAVLPSIQSGTSMGTCRSEEWLSLADWLDEGGSMQQQSDSHGIDGGDMVEEGAMVWQSWHDDLLSQDRDW